MKKLLLIPTAVFPYSFCACLAYGFGSGHFSGDLIITALGILCLLCFILAIICNIVFMILSRKQDSKELLKATLILKMIHIPSYILIFILGLLMGIMFFMTFPFIIFLVFIDCITLFLSGMIAVWALVKSIKQDAVISIVTLICQFFFCADIISLFVMYFIIRKRKKALSE